MVCHACQTKGASLIDSESRGVLPEGWTTEIYTEDGGRTVYFCPSCTSYLGAKPKTRKNRITKGSEIRLTDKQLAVLQIVFEIDQERETAEKNKYFKWLDGERARPATEWRWICYGISAEEAIRQSDKISIPDHIEIFGISGGWLSDGSSELKTKLDKEKLDNQGLGRIFSTLAAKSLIKHEKRIIKIGATAFEMPFVQMTRQGRRLMRERLGIEKPEKTSKLFPEWLWLILDRLDAEGSFKRVDKEGNSDKYGDYGNVQWRIWLQLKRHQKGALVEEFRDDDDYRLRLTELGKKLCDDHRKNAGSRAEIIS